MAMGATQSKLEAMHLGARRRVRGRRLEITFGSPTAS